MKLELVQGSRSKILALIVLGIMSVFAIRLFYLQVIRHDHYVALADQEQLKHIPIPAKRGVIYALDGSSPTKVVMNEMVYTVFVDPQIIKDDEKVLQSIRDVAGGTMRPGAKEMIADKKSRYQIIATKLTRSQADKLKEKDLLGVGFHEVSQRVYPEGGLAGQLLGFVDAEGNGQYGVEGKLNDTLKGKAGTLQTVTDIRDVPLTIGDRNIRTPKKDGENIVLSIDRNIQSYAEDALRKGLDKAGGKTGSVVVMDPKTGEVKAMANYPSYAPADFSKVTDASLFNNAVISSPYEPASVIKTFTMAAGLDKGVITPQTTYVNTDSIKVYDRTIFNAFRGLTGTRTMQDVLNNSLNTGTVTIAQRLGDGENVTRQSRDVMYDYFHNRFGLGTQTGIELSNEAVGTLIAPDQVEGNAVRYSNMTFGQGLDVTMIQVASGFSSVVNGGRYYNPTMIHGSVDDTGALKESAHNSVRSTISPEASATMRTMLQDSRKSVSYMSSQDRPGYTIGGKTGTAETIKNGVYTKTETVGTYLGFGGNDTPQYVIMVQVAAPGKNMEGGIHASPIFTDISNWMIDYQKIQPKG